MLCGGPLRRTLADFSPFPRRSGELTVNKHLPFIFLFSTKTIDKGEEVLIDYGSLYWKLFHARLEAHKQMCQRAFEMRTLLAGGTA